MGGALHNCGGGGGAAPPPPPPPKPELPSRLLLHGLGGSKHGSTDDSADDQIIWTCITRCHPEEPPVPEEVEIQLPGGGTAGPTKFLTYGAYILDAEFWWCDEELRHTVVWCLAHHPEDRPGLATLLRVVDRKGGPQLVDPGHVPGMTDEQLRAWVQRLLREPAPKPLPKYDPAGPAYQVSVVVAVFGVAPREWFACSHRMCTDRPL